ncbi:hypothetical protein GLOIN_2v1876445 [Rhizophagus irregularis DAOM 181602=DAOM 197198]|nr:hypothetical protein GLOIN_2v1876445 [Rhizophagus irregularis DAOM 181602=DAOM 197198]
MTYQLPTLPTDCLNNIVEFLENDKDTLHSCLLVNRLWCKVSVRILWRDLWDNKERSLRMASSILSTLIACLPNKSKEILFKNGIFISTPTSKSPLFDYTAFCQVLLICEINKIVYNVLRDIPSNNSLSLQDRYCLVTNEIIKMFMNQVSLKKLSYIYNHYQYNLSFTYFFEVRNLSELHCGTNLNSDFYYRLSQTCRNLQSISIEFYSNEVSSELKELISLQNNLKKCTLIAYYGNSWENIIPSITNHSNTLTKLHLCSDYTNLSLSFVSLFPNLQEIVFSFLESADFEDFKVLQFSKFPNLQILKIPYHCPKPEYVMRFLEINGKNLKNFYISENDKDLKRIKIWCGGEYLTVEKVLETIVNHSSNNFHELKIHNSSNSAYVSSEILELFFMRWKNRLPKKSLNLIGVVKFRTRSYYEEGKEEEN